MKTSVFIPLIALAYAMVNSCSDYREAEAPEGFSVNERRLTFSMNSETQSLQVSSGTKWDVSSMPEWLSIQSISRSNNSLYEWIVGLTATTNNEFNREGVVLLSTNTSSVDVTVTQAGKKGDPIPVTSISISPSELNLTEGETANLSVSFSPSNASDKRIKWKSSSPSVTQVDSDGKVTAYNPGSAIIIAETCDGGKTAQCPVTVKFKVYAESVFLNKHSLTLLEGGSEMLIATIAPENVWKKSVSWNSSNTAVASVNTDGIVTAISPGYATITASASDGSRKKDLCQVAVVDGIENGYGWIDLGFSGIKWGGCNVGAESYADLGNRFTWNNAKSIIHDTWGGKWYLPSIEDYRGMVKNCSFSMTSINNVDIVRVISNINGRELLLPLPLAVTEYGSAPQGHYWSSTQYSNSQAYSFVLGKYIMLGQAFFTDTSSTQGFAAELFVRPVLSE